MIFESRPNVAADASALALRAGNAVLLRGGADSAESVAAIVAVLREALAEAGLPADAVQAAPSSDRAAVGMMLAGLNGAIDVIIPRGGKSLVARVQAEARVPVFAHLEGVNHTTCTPKPIRKRRSISSSTPRCAAFQFAARLKNS